MSIIAVAVTLGNPDSAGIFPVSSTSVASGIGQAQTDLATLASDIAAVATAAGTTDTDVGIVQTDITAAIGAYQLTLAAEDAALGTPAGAVANLFSLGYASHLITGTAVSPVTLSAAQQNALVVLLNAAQNLLLATGNDLTTANTDAATAKTASHAASVAAAALSTTDVSNDLAAAVAGIVGADVYIQSDSSTVANMAQMNAALVTALSFLRDSNVLPT